MKKDNKKSSKKIYVILIFIILVLIAFVSFEAYIYTKNKGKVDSLNGLEYVGILEDGTYYIPKASKNIRFQINSNDTNSYILKDEKENIIESKIVNQKEKNLIEAINEYEEGKTYYLELVNTNFSEERFKDAKKVKFKIEEQEKANYTISNNAKYLSYNVDIQDNNGTKTLKVDNSDYKANDILLQKENEKLTNAYKISEIKNGVATLIKPEVSEIYEDIDLHKESKISFEDVEINEEFKDQIKLAVKKSPLYQFLVNECYAAEEPDIDIKVEKGDNDSIKLGISITIPASGGAFLGVPSLSNHDISFNFSIEIENNFIADVEKDENIDIDVSLKETMDFSVTLTSKTKLLDETIDITDSVSHDLVKQLGSYGLDSTGGSPKLCGIDLGMGAPGIDVYFDIRLPLTLTMQIQLALNQHIEIIQNMGVMTNENNESVPYSTIMFSSSKTDFSIVGKANLKMGLEIDMGIAFISKDFAHIGFKDEMGLYGDIFATANVSYDNLTKKQEGDFVGKIEFGFYNTAKFDAGIDIFFYSQDFSQTISDVKKPIYSYGNTQKLQDTIATIRKEITENNKEYANADIPTQTPQTPQPTPPTTQQEVNTNDNVEVAEEPVDDSNVNQNVNPTESNDNASTDVDVGTTILSDDPNVGTTTNDKELQKMLADDLNNTINNLVLNNPDNPSKDANIPILLIQKNLNERWKIVKVWQVTTTGNPLDWVEPSTVLSAFGEGGKYITYVDHLTIYDNVSGKEFIVRVFRTTDIPFVHYVSMNVITNDN